MPGAIEVNRTRMQAKKKKKAIPGHSFPLWVPNVPTHWGMFSCGQDTCLLEVDDLRLSLFLLYLYEMFPGEMLADVYSSERTSIKDQLNKSKFQLGKSMCSLGYLQKHGGHKGSCITGDPTSAWVMNKTCILEFSAEHARILKSWRISSPQQASMII